MTICYFIPPTKQYKEAQFSYRKSGQEEVNMMTIDRLQIDFGCDPNRGLDWALLGKRVGV